MEREHRAALFDAAPDAPDFWTTPEPGWRERWVRWLDETTVGAEVIRDDYSTPKGAEVSDG